MFKKNWSREEKAQQLRDKGMTLRAIGAELGVGAERVRGMLNALARKQERGHEQLSTRTLNAMAAHFGTSAYGLDACQVGAATPTELLNIPNLGATGIKETIQWLEANGQDTSKLKHYLLCRENRQAERYFAELDLCAKRLRLAGYTVTEPSNDKVQADPEAKP